MSNSFSRRQQSSRKYGQFFWTSKVTFPLTPLYFLSPHWIRWCTKRRTPTVPSISGQWRETPLTASSWPVWGSTCSMRSRFWLSHGLEMDTRVLPPSWRELWMMCPDLQWASCFLKCGPPQSALFGSRPHSPTALYWVSNVQMSLYFSCFDLESSLKMSISTEAESGHAAVFLKFCYLYLEKNNHLIIMIYRLLFLWYCYKIMHYLRMTRLISGDDGIIYPLLGYLSG